MVLVLLCVPHQETSSQNTPTSEETGSRAERLQTLERLQRTADELAAGGQTLESGRVLVRMGRIALTLNQPGIALSHFQKAHSLLGTGSDPVATVDTLNGLATAYTVLQQSKEAKENCAAALALSESANYVAGQAAALLTLSENENYDDHAQAQATASRALQLYQQINDEAGVGEAHARIGDYFLAQNMVSQASQSYQSSLEIWRRLGNAEKQGGMLVHLGFVESRKGDWDNSIRYLTEAQALTNEESDPAQRGRIAAGLGDAFNETGLAENGLEHSQRALEFYRQTQNTHLITYGTWGVGWAYLILQNYPEATRYFEESLAMAPPGGLMAALNQECLGRIYSDTGNLQEALRRFEIALPIFATKGNPREAAQVQALIAQANERLGRTAAARAEYQTAIAAFNQISDRMNEAAVSFALGRLELNEENFEPAEKNLLRSLEITEQLVRSSSTNDLTTAFSASVFERYHTYVDCLMRQHAKDPARQKDVLAFETSDLSRARSLADLVRSSTNGVGGLAPNLAQREKELRQNLWVKENEKIFLLSRQHAPDQLEKLETELKKLADAHEQVLQEIKQAAPGFAGLTRPQPWTLRQIQENVVTDPETVLLEYSLGPKKSYAWAITANGFKSYELAGEDQINAAAAPVYNQVSVGPKKNTANELDVALRELSRLVIAPIADQLEGRTRIILVADGLLNYIPFQILKAPSSNEPLVANFEVVNTPSAAILGELRQGTAQRQPATRVLAAFGNPVFSANYSQAVAAGEQTPLLAANLPTNPRLQSALRDLQLSGDEIDRASMQPLFFAKRELARLGEVASSGAPFIASDFAATREELLRTDLSQYSILHLATHGLLNPRRPENSGLVLSTVTRDGQQQDGFIGLREIYGLKAPVDLVVLSACQTALGRDVRGEGLLGLTRGFMYAGASSVVSSLWKVDDEVTAALMPEFYENLLHKKLPPAAALRAAQNSIRQRPGWESPYFWAAFTLQGEYRNPIEIRTQRSYAKALIWILLPLVAAGSAWFYFRRRNSPAK